jgi:hypothetical protein
VVQPLGARHEGVVLTPIYRRSHPGEAEPEPERPDLQAGGGADERRRADRGVRVPTPECPFGRLKGVDVALDGVEFRADDCRGVLRAVQPLLEGVGLEPPGSLVPADRDGGGGVDRLGDQPLARGRLERQKRNPVHERVLVARKRRCPRDAGHGGPIGDPRVGPVVEGSAAPDGLEQEQRRQDQGGAHRGRLRCGPTKRVPSRRLAYDARRIGFGKGFLPGRWKLRYAADG